MEDVVCGGDVLHKKLYGAFPPEGFPVSVVLKPMHTESLPVIDAVTEETFIRSEVVSVQKPL